MTRTLFTGERLHEGDELFGVDLARHRAAYRFALETVDAGPLLDLGCGSGYGTAGLAEALSMVVGVDRIAPDASARRPTAHFLRADLCAIPLAPGSFAWITSFQVIEHLEDPTPYLDAVATLLRPGGAALLTTPNALTSDGVNPFHVHEFEAAELEACLRTHFEQVEVRGIGASPAVRDYLEARLTRVRRIIRLDPLGLREYLPRPLIEILFGAFARVVRRGIQKSGSLPDVDWRDFPIGAPLGDCLDLLAICRDPIPLDAR